MEICALMQNRLKRDSKCLPFFSPNLHWSSNSPNIVCCCNAFGVYLVESSVKLIFFRTACSVTCF